MPADAASEESGDVFFLLLMRGEQKGNIRITAIYGAVLVDALDGAMQKERFPMPYYHLQQDQLRVMEVGLPLVRVSPNGYSAFIDKTGRVAQRTKLNTEKILYVDF